MSFLKCSLTTLTAIVFGLLALITGKVVTADNNYFALSSVTPLTQDWSNGGLITANNKWSGVPSITGYRGDDGATSALSIDPRTVLADYSATPYVSANRILSSAQELPNLRSPIRSSPSPPTVPRFSKHRH